MFLRKLISTSLIISASIGSSIAVGAGAQDALRVNTKGFYGVDCIVFVPNAPTHRLAVAIKALGSGLFDDLIAVVVGVDDSQVKADSLELVMLKSKKRAQNAENKARQDFQRKALRRVEKSFKAPLKSLHQPR